MNGLFLVCLVVAVSLTQSGADPVGTCPPLNEVTHVDFLTDSADCSKFYKCDWGSPVLYTCPGGLHFNPTIDVCDWPKNAGCTGDGSGVTPSAPTPTTPDGGNGGGDCDSSKCPAKNGEFVDFVTHPDCGKFCMCDWGVAIEFDCPAGLHFNPTLNVCDWPENAGCTGGEGDTKPTPTSPTPTPTTDSTGGGEGGNCDSSKCPTENGEFVDFLTHSDCGKFCKCDWGVAIEFNCPTGLHFNPTLNVCDWPENAGCTGGDGDTKPTPASPIPTTESTTSEGHTTPSVSNSTGGGEGGSCDSSKCPAENGEFVDFLTHPDCGKFCKCDWGVAIEFDCPTGLHFNPTLNVCDWPENAGCTGGDGDTKPTPASPTPTTESTTSEGHTTPSISNSTGGGEGGSCDSSKCPAENGEFVDFLTHSDCGKFCKCDWGVAIEFDCPTGLHFNPTLNVCDWPENAGCAGGDGDTKPTPASPTPTPTTESTTSEGHTTPSISNSTGGGEAGSCDSSKCPVENGEFVDFLTHSDCGKFCKCDWGVAIEFDCPTGLHFNPTLNVCDWPENAGCAGGDGDTKPTPASPTPNTDSTTSEGQTTPSISNSTGGGEGGSCDSSKCPAENGEFVDFLTHPDCGKFCKCDWGVAIEFDCPTGLHFNPTLNVCDWPENAGCTGGDGDTKPTPAPPTPTTESTTSEGHTTPSISNSTGGGEAGSCDSSKCPAENGEFVDFLTHSDCGKFCKCDWGVAIEFDCPTGLHFNPTLNVCDWPENAGCAGGDIDTKPTPASPTPTTESTTSEGHTTPSISNSTGGGEAGSCDSSKCPAENGEFVDFLTHSDCGKFCKCDWGVAIEFDCPTGLHFNPTLNVCDWPEDAGCTGDVSTISTTTSPTTTPTTTSPTTTPTTTSPTTTPTPEASGDCDSSKCPPVDEGLATLLQHKDCTKFCKCSWGTAHVYDCDAGLHFNPILKVCDWPEDAGCK